MNEGETTVEQPKNRRVELAEIIDAYRPETPETSFSIVKEAVTELVYLRAEGGNFAGMADAYRRGASAAEIKISHDMRGIESTGNPKYQEHMRLELTAAEAVRDNYYTQEGACLIEHAKSNSS